jgi:hypothetical protein
MRASPTLLTAGGTKLRNGRTEQESLREFAGN